MDATRAEQVLEAALSGAQAARARVVILDVTGIKGVDAGVAGTVMRAAAALRLIGVRAVITGIRPEVARTLVELGVDLGGIVTRGTLQRGVAHALRHAAEK